MRCLCSGVSVVLSDETKTADRLTAGKTQESGVFLTTVEVADDED